MALPQTAHAQSQPEKFDQITIISDSISRAEDIARQLPRILTVRLFARRNLGQAKPGKYTIIDIDLDDRSDFVELKQWLDRRPRLGRAIFTVTQGSRRQVVQACALGANDCVERPVDRHILLAAMFADLGLVVGNQVAAAIGDAGGVVAGICALHGLFDSVTAGTPVDLKMAQVASEAIVEQIDTQGVAGWIDIVRRHHMATYQHSLLVAGIAVAFGQHLGFAAEDKRKLALGGLLHDIGKAGVPLTILEKPGPLNDEETAVMRRHALVGYEVLQGVKGLHSDMLDVVAHHHERLDGSGYPHGLKGRQVSDLVRLVTIVDIFAALIERRSYRPAFSRDEACRELENMVAKLDADMVREFVKFIKAQMQ